jgi:hypothetical protein
MTPKKQSLKAFLWFLIGSVFSTIALTILLKKVQVNPEEDLLNPGTHVLFEKVNSRLIHCKDCRDIKECIDGHNQSGVENSVVLLGNSQIHAINQYLPGQPGAPSLLFDSFKKDSLDFVAMSYGNANIQEHAVQFLYLSDKMKIKTVAIGLVFDDTREDGVRENVYEFIETDSVTRSMMNNFPVGKELIQRGHSENSSLQKEADRNFQKKLEAKLDKAMASSFTLWKLRNEIAYHFFIGLRGLRNYAFNIKPTTIRKQIPDTYQRNLSSLRMMMEVAKKKGVQVVAYIAPIRNDVALPYVPEEYAKFKVDVQSMAAEYPNVTFANLEGVVPPAYWGEKNSTNLSNQLELDFMHFNTKGHVVLARELYKLIIKR